MDFDKISLTSEERQLLRKSEYDPVPLEKCGRLLRFGLAEEEIEHIPGYRGKRLGTCRITEKGKDYLIWLDNEFEKLNENRAKDAAKETRDHIFELKKTVFMVLLSSAVTLLIEHWSEIFNVLRQYIQQILSLR